MARASTPVPTNTPRASFLSNRHLFDVVEWRGYSEHTAWRLQVSTFGPNAPYDPELPEVLFEMVAIGNAVKVSAIDPISNIEVSVMGPATASTYTLKMNALRKLKARLRKVASQAPAKSLKGQLI